MHNTKNVTLKNHVLHDKEHYMKYSIEKHSGSEIIQSPKLKTHSPTHSCMIASLEASSYIHHFTNNDNSSVGCVF